MRVRRRQQPLFWVAARVVKTGHGEFFGPRALRRRREADALAPPASVGAPHDEVDVMLTCEVPDAFRGDADASLNRCPEPGRFVGSQVMVEALPRFLQEALPQCPRSAS